MKLSEKKQDLHKKNPWIKITYHCWERLSGAHFKNKIKENYKLLYRTLYSFASVFFSTRTVRIYGDAWKEFDVNSCAFFLAL